MQEKEQVRPEDADKFVIPKDWKNPPSLLDLKADLTEADSDHRAQVKKIDTWVDNLNMTGNAKISPKAGRSSVQPKLIRKQAEWRYASLSEPFLSSDKMISASPETWEDKDGAVQAGIVLNNQFNTKINKQKFIDTAVRAAVDEGTAIFRVGWNFKEIEVEEEQPIYEFQPNPGMAQVLEEVAQIQQRDPTTYRFEIPQDLKEALRITQETGTPVEPIVIGYETVTVTKTVKNHPTVGVENYKRVIPDPTCEGDIDKANFVVYKFPTSYSELKAEGDKYTNLDYIHLDNNSILGAADADIDVPQTFNFRDKARKKILAYEYWGYHDIDGTGLLKPFVATWVGDTLIRMEESPIPGGELPFIFVPLMPVKDSLYGEPDGELLEDNQKIIGAVTRGMIDIMARSANGQEGTLKGALDATNKRKKQRGENYEFNASGDPRAAFHMHTFAEIPASAQFMIQAQNYDAESMTGVKAFSDGINSGSLGDVARGISGALDAAGKRESGYLRRISAGLVEVCRKFMAMNAEFMDEEEVVRVTNDVFEPVRRDDLSGEFDYAIDVSTAEEDNAKAQELSFMLQTLGNNVDWGVLKEIFVEIARLRKMPDLAKRIEEYEPQPDPLQQEIAQLQKQELLEKIKLLQAQTQDKFTEADLNQAKAVDTMASAREKDSKADINDLNFVEQEQGVTQEREKELQSEQSRGNMRLKSHEYALKKQLDDESAVKTYMDGKNPR